MINKEGIKICRFTASIPTAIIIFVTVYIIPMDNKEQIKLDKSNSVCRGVVIGKSYGGRNQGIRYRYEINGEKYFGTESGSKIDYAYIGDSIDVKYITEEPDINKIINYSRYSSPPMSEGKKLAGKIVMRTFLILLILMIIALYFPKQTEKISNKIEEKFRKNKKKNHINQ